MIFLFFSLFFHHFLLFHLLFFSRLFSFLRFSLLSFSSLFSCLLLLFSFSFSFSLFRLLFSLSVFFLCLHSPCVGGVCVSSCVVVCVCVCVVVWCGVCRVVWHAENPVCRLKTLSALSMGLHGAARLPHALCPHQFSVTVLHTNVAVKNRYYTSIHHVSRTDQNCAVLKRAENIMRHVEMWSVVRQKETVRGSREDVLKVERFIHKRSSKFISRVRTP